MKSRYEAMNAYGGGVFWKSAQLDGAGLQVEQWGAAPAGDGDWHVVRKCTMAG